MVPLVTYSTQFAISGDWRRSSHAVGWALLVYSMFSIQRKRWMVTKLCFITACLPSLCYILADVLWLIRIDLEHVHYRWIRAELTTLDS